MTTNPAVTSPATQPAAIVVPAPGTYRIDVARSAIMFTTRHLFGLGPVRGGLDLREGEIRVTDPLPESSARAKISAASFAPATPAATARSGRPGCSTPAHTPTSPSSPGGSTRPMGAGSCTACCRCAGRRTRSSWPSRRPSRPAGPAPAGERPPRPLRLRDHQGQGPGRPAPRPGARHRRPPAVNRAVIGRRRQHMAVIDVEHFHKRYGDKVAVDDVSFTVEEGEIFGVLGRNGAGKTTTVECVVGLRRPDGGLIRVLGMDPQRGRARAAAAGRCPAAGERPARQAHRRRGDRPVRQLLPHPGGRPGAAGASRPGRQARHQVQEAARRPEAAAVDRAGADRPALASLCSTSSRPGSTRRPAVAPGR